MEPPVAQSLQQFHSRIHAVEELLRRSEGTVTGILGRIKASEMAVQTIHKITNERIPNDFRAIAEDIGNVKKKMDVIDTRARPMIDGAIVQYDTELKKHFQALENGLMKSVVDSQNTTQATLRKDREESQTGIRKVSDYLQAEARGNQQLSQEVKGMGDQMKELQHRIRDIEVTTGKRLDQQQTTLVTMKKELGDYVNQLMDAAMSKFREELAGTMQHVAAVRGQINSDVVEAIQHVRDEVGHGLNNASKSISNLDDTTQALEAVLRAEVKARMSRLDDINHRVQSLEEGAQIEHFNKERQAGATTADVEEISRVHRLAADSKSQSDRSARNVAALQDEIKSLAGQLKSIRQASDEASAARGVADEAVASAAARAAIEAYTAATAKSNADTIPSAAATKSKSAAESQDAVSSSNTAKTTNSGDYDTLQKELDRLRHLFTTYKDHNETEMKKAHRTIELLAGQLGGVTDAVETIQASTVIVKGDTSSPNKSRSGGGGDDGDMEGLTKEIYSDIRGLKSKVRANEVSTDAELERISDEVRALKQQIRLGGGGSGGGTDPAIAKTLSEMSELESALRNLSKKMGVSMEEIQGKLHDVETQSERIQDVGRRLERSWAADKESLSRGIETNSKRIDELSYHMQNNKNIVSAHNHIPAVTDLITTSPPLTPRRVAVSEGTPATPTTPRRQGGDTEVVNVVKTSSSPSTTPRGKGARNPQDTHTGDVVDFHTFDKNDKKRHQDVEEEGDMDPADAEVEDLPLEQSHRGSGPGPGPDTLGKSSGRIAASSTPTRQVTSSVPSPPKLQQRGRDDGPPPVSQLINQRRGGASATPMGSINQGSSNNKNTSATSRGSLNPLVAPPVKKSAPKQSPAPVQITPRDKKPSITSSSPGWAAPDA